MALLIYMAVKGYLCFCSAYRKQQLKLKPLTLDRPNTMFLWPKWGFWATIKIVLHLFPNSSNSTAAKIPILNFSEFGISLPSSLWNFTSQHHVCLNNRGPITEQALSRSWLLLLEQPSTKILCKSIKWKYTSQLPRIK